MQQHRENRSSCIFALQSLSLLVILLIATSVSISAQVKSMSSKTPAGIAPGAPTGSFPLSGFENVNLYSGNLNFSLPLLQIGGRGGSKTSMNLTINNQRWHMERTDSFVISGQEGSGGGGINKGPDEDHNYDPSEIYSLLGGTVIVQSGWIAYCNEICEFGSLHLAVSPPPDMSPITNSGGGGGTAYSFPSPTWWGGLRVGYGPGVLQGRWMNGPGGTLTRLTFTGPDGTEYEMRNVDSNGEPQGQPIPHSLFTYADRGTVFKTADGTSLTFISDAMITEPGHTKKEFYVYPSGYLWMPDGTCYRIQKGLVSWIRDRNDNVIRFQYGNNTNPAVGSSWNKLTKVTDSLGRVVNITYRNIPNPNKEWETYDEIKYTGFDGAAERSIKVWRTRLSESLRSDYPGLWTYSQLFPGVSGEDINQQYEAEGMVFKVELPDTRSYELQYNPYGELARVELPTGGAIAYDYNLYEPLAQHQWSGLYDELTIYRRVFQRKVYEDATTPISRQFFKPTFTGNGSEQQPWKTNVAVEQYDITGGTERLATYDKHYFYGYPVASMAPRVDSPNLYYSDWKEGKEYLAETYDVNTSGPTSLLRSVEQKWQPRAEVSWWTGPSYSRPVIDPQLTETITKLHDVSPALFSKQQYAYDNSNGFNNQTDVWEYGFGTDVNNLARVRHTQTRFLITGPVSTPTPTPTPTPAASPSPTPGDPENPGCPTCRFTGDNTSGLTAQDYLGRYLMKLPAEVRVFAVDGGQEQLRSRTEYLYDETAPTPTASSEITGRPLPPGEQPTGEPVEPAVSLAHGNVTSTKAWVDPGNTDPSINAVLITSRVKYDILGNVIETTDANNNVTTISFEDSFGYPDGNARGAAHASLNGKKTYALPSSITNALGQIAYAKYDYYSGSPVTSEDANGIKANMFYNDVFGRATQLVTAVGTSLQQQSTVSYNDHAHTITTTSDLNRLDDNKLKSESIYDGLGRTTETHSYENNSSYVTTKQFYDGLGRVIKATNPYRSTGDSTYGEIETTYDALGRVTKVKTTPDNAEVKTVYAGNEVTVTDQADKQRRIVTDAPGRLTNVFEASNTPGFNYETRYVYDALDNLIKVTQGPQDTTNDQIRTFSYDGLSRLKSGANPESGTITYTYDANGNLLEKTDPRLLAGTSTHVKTNYTYDALNRVTKRSYNDATPEVNYFYDAQVLPTGAPTLARGASIGQLLAASYGGSNSINGTYYGYDAIGRAIKSAQVTGGQTFPTMEYGYNLSGSMTSQKYPSGREVTTAYDDVGRLSSVSGTRTGEIAKTYVSLPSYGAHGAITALKLGNDLWERTSFNRRLQPTEIKLGLESNQESVLKLSYSYGAADNNGNVKSQTITVPSIGTATGFTATQNYDYDPLNRLKSAQELSGSTQNWKQTYSYDQFGNRRLSYADGATTIPIAPTTPQDIAIYNPEISPANNNRLVGYEYDLAGNVSRDAQNRTFAYDPENHQIAYNGGAVINNGDSASYSYDGDGKRVKKQVGGSMTSTVFVYNITGQLAAEYTDSQEPRTAQTSYVTTDTLGSTRVITGQNQSPKERHDYLPFGEHIGAQGERTVEQKFDVNVVRQKFTGYERDGESGLDFAQNRYYASPHGRYTSVDPASESMRFADPQTLNRYTYCLNNPQLYVDPDGLSPDEPEQYDPTIVVGNWDQLTRRQQELFVTYTKANSTPTPEGTVELFTPEQMAELTWNCSALMANSGMAGPLDQSQLTTFVGVTSMWSHTNVIDSIASVTEIRGAVAEDNFALRGTFKDGSGAYIESHWNKIPGETHDPYVTSRREEDVYGQPNGQFKLTSDRRGFQSDVDYNRLLIKGTFFPNPAHNRSSNSDVRHDGHLERHTGEYGPIPVTRVAPTRGLKVP